MAINLRLLFIIGLLSLISYSLCAQSLIESKLRFKYPVMNYTPQNGLLQSQVVGITQDSKGRMYFATAAGISIFDGANFSALTIEDGLPSICIYIHMDKHDRLWVASYNAGLTCLTEDSVYTWTTDNGLPTNDNNILYRSVFLEDAKGNMWFSPNTGLVRISNNCEQVHNYEELTEHTVSSMLIWQDKLFGICSEGVFSIDSNDNLTMYPNTANCYSLLIAPTNALLTQNASGLLKFNNNQWEVIDINISADELGIIRSAIIDSKGHIWVAGSKGLFHSQDWKTLQHINASMPPLIWMKERRNGEIWAVSQNYVPYRIRKNTFKALNTESGILDNYTNGIYIDKQDNVWISSNKGVSQYGKVIFEILDTESGLPNDQIGVVAASPNGTIYCNSQTGTITQLSEQLGVRPHANLPNEKFYAEVSALATFPNGNLLASGSYYGLYQFQDGKINNTYYRREHANVTAVLAINNDEFYAANAALGVVHHQKDKKQIYGEDEGLPPTNISKMVKDQKGRICCATDNGLAILDNGKVYFYTSEHGLPADYCTDITIGNDNTIWLGTENGLCRITEATADSLTLQVYTTQEGMGDNLISMVETLNDGRILVGHVNGLNIINPEDGSIRHYTSTDGYLPMDCYLGASACDPDGNIWIGTVGGLVRYLPEADVLDTVPPTLLLNVSLPDSLNIADFCDGFDSITKLPINLELPYEHNRINFNWVGVHLTNPAKNRYRYILHGLDKNWTNNSTDTKREYLLPYGQYTLSVYAANCDGVWTKEPIEFTFTILPPWYLTWWAIVLYIIVLVALIFGIVKWNNKRLIAQNRELEQKVAERTKEIEEKNHALEQNQQEIKLRCDIALEQKELIEEQRKEIVESIQYAERIQKAIMPKEHELKEWLPEHFLIFLPRDIVSGDYYWAAPLPDGKVVMLVADCTGHGVPGAFMSMIGISSLNNIILENGQHQPDKILNDMRQSVKFTLAQTGAIGEQRDGMDMSLIILDIPNKLAHYAGANNPLYLIRNGELTEYKADKMPIGVYVKEDDFKMHTIEVQSGDMLYIFSDGYIDQFGGPDEVKFKSKPFKTMLTQVSSLPVDEQKEIILKRHKEWKGACQQVDDVSVMGVRIP